MVVLKQKFGLVNDVSFYVCGWLRRVDVFFGYELPSGYVKIAIENGHL
jgi:hypothetical protein